MTGVPLKQWQTGIFKLYDKVKTRIKLKLLQGVKEKGELGLPDLKLYFSPCHQVWMKDWMILRNERLLALEGHDLGFGWHV